MKRWNTPTTRSLFALAMAGALLLATAVPVVAAPASAAQDDPGLFSEQILHPIVTGLLSVLGLDDQGSQPAKTSAHSRSDRSGKDSDLDWQCTDCTQAGNQLDPDG